MRLLFKRIPSTSLAIGIVTALAATALSTPTFAQGGAQSGAALPGPSAIRGLGDTPCEVLLPFPPTDPSVDADYSCYYFGNYNWNSGNGSGFVRGRIYWPSICNDGTTNPPGELPLPTVLFMHGDGHDYLDYGYLMRHLAFNGFIVATIENSGSNAERSLEAQNFLSFMANDWQYRDWVDRDNMGLIGHSRSGEAVLKAARDINQLGLDYDINTIISLAPTDSHEGGGVHEDLVGSSSESLLVIYGTHDEDVTGYCISGGLPQCGNVPAGPRSTGFGLYDRAGSEGETEPFPLYDEVVDKALIYIEGANHNSWRSICSDPPFFGNLNCTEHHEMAMGYMNAYLRWKLRGMEIYRNYFTGDFVLPTVRREGIEVHHSFSNGYDRRVVDNFEQPGWGTNSLGGLVWKASSLTVEKDGTTWDYEYASPHDTRSLTVSWTPGGFAPWLRFDVPNVSTLFGGRYRDVTRFDYLSLRAGQVYGSPHNTPGESKDFWVQLRDSHGGQSSWVKVSDYADLPYPTVAMVTKFQQTLTVVNSPMKTIRIPVCRFDGIDLQNVSSVYFYFTVAGSVPGELMIDNLEFTH